MWTIASLTRPVAALAIALTLAGCSELGWLGPNAPGAIDQPPNAGGGGGGVVGPAPVPGGNGGGIDPGHPGNPGIEKPVAGQLNPIAVSVVQIQPSVSAHHVSVLLSWWSGVPPCSVLDSVTVVRDGTSITMTPFEGADPSTNGGPVACPAIAALHGTIVDLGELEPGTYTLVAHGDLAPIQVTVE
ncbi:MAG: hypothetical protein ABIV26_08405 [Candidatus Limnocylindrales bacterium]